MYIFLITLAIFYIGVMVMSYGIKNKKVLFTWIGLLMYTWVGVFIIFKTIFYITKLV